MWEKGKGRMMMMRRRWRDRLALKCSRNRT
jgi:hypothetical protein